MFSVLVMVSVLWMPLVLGGQLFIYIHSVECCYTFHCSSWRNYYKEIVNPSVSKGNEVILCFYFMCVSVAGGVLGLGAGAVGGSCADDSGIRLSRPTVLRDRQQA